MGLVIGSYIEVIFVLTYLIVWLVLEVMGKKRSRQQLVDEEEKMAIDEEEELELEIRAAKEIMREKMRAGELPEGSSALLARLAGGSDDDEEGGEPMRYVNNEVRGKTQDVLCMGVIWSGVRKLMCDLLI
jgi:hypothetical protein